MMRHSVSRHSRESGRPVHAVVDVKIETTVIAGSSAFTDDDTEIEGAMKPAALSIAVALFLASPPAPAEEGQKSRPSKSAPVLKFTQSTARHVTARACKTPAVHSTCGDFRTTSASASSARSSAARTRCRHGATSSSRINSRRCGPTSWRASVDYQVDGAGPATSGLQQLRAQADIDRERLRWRDGAVIGGRIGNRVDDRLRIEKGAEGREFAIEQVVDHTVDLQLLGELI